MKFGIITLASSIHDKKRIREHVSTLLTNLGKRISIEEIVPERIDTVDIPLVCILTGGTEHEFCALYPKLAADGRPITLLTLPHSNSLPAGLEMLAWLNAQGSKGARLLHGDPAMLAQKIGRRGMCLALAVKLRSSVIGVIGKPSDWLIASGVSYDALQKRFGLRIREIPIEEVYDAYAAVPADEVAKALREFQEPRSIAEPTENDREAAARLYVAMRRVVASNGLTAVTLRCFDLLQKLGTTGCLALSRLNDEGVTAGCEGDVPALLTMHVHRILSGEASFMANPSVFLGDDVVFAHCTVASSIVDNIKWRSHFESGIGVGISGTYRPGTMTVIRLGGHDLGKVFIAEGEVVPHEFREDLCRTQVRIRLPGVVDTLGRVPLGNHHILARGAWKDIWSDALEPFGIDIGS